MTPDVKQVISKEVIFVFIGRKRRQRSAADGNWALIFKAFSGII